MDLYILDQLFRRSVVVDKFESLIWTERFNSKGEFVLQIESTAETRRLFRKETRLSIPNSKRVMVVTTIEDKVDDNDKRFLEVKAKSIEKIMDDRVAKDSLDSLGTTPKWVLTGTPATIARTIFQSICVDGILDSADIIPFLVSGNIFPADTIDEPIDVITVELEPQTLYEAIENLAQTYELGFRLVLEPDTSNLYFNIYAGVDRTTLQTENTPLLFSPELDNLQNATEFTSSQDEKNVAYVFSDYGTSVVYAPHIDPTVEGFERRVLIVKADGISGDTVDVPAALTLAGLEALAKAKVVSLFDGEASVGPGLVYGTDYNLGDVVELRNTDGEVAYKRVTEFIFTSDATGDHAYPTLSQGFDNNTETWDSIPELDVWDGYTTEVWDDFV